MRIHTYAAELFEGMAEVDDFGIATKRVTVVHYPPHVRSTMPDHCIGETAEEVFEELSWELAMADARAMGGTR